MAFIIFYMQVLFYPIAVFVICGLAVALCNTWFHKLAGRSGRVLVYATSIVGTPVHEAGHAVMCILFFHKITSLSLWQPRNPNGVLGYVEHSYNKKNPYKVLGNLFIGLGPIFSGLCIILAVIGVCFPAALAEYMESSVSILGNGDGLLHVFFECMKLIPSVIYEDSMPLWVKIIGIFIMLSVSLHINLSPSDILGSLRSLPIYMIIALIFSGTVYFTGMDNVFTVVFKLKTFALYTSVIYMIVIICAIILVGISFVFFIFRKIFGQS